MRTAWHASWLLLILPRLCAGQSLGDAAQKEHQRREKLGKTEGPSRIIKDEDLAANKGKLANEADAAPEPALEGEDPEPARERPAPTGFHLPEGPDAMPPAGGEGYWRGRVGEARGRVERAQRRHDSLERQIRFGQPDMYNENGQQVIYSIYQMKAKADEADAELGAAQKALEDLYTEARRAGALPGWLR
jgi:hypothetical protein